jgi:uncharacterized protein (TIGR00251 family)
MLPLKESPNGITFSIQVVPRASKCEVTGIVNDALKIRLTAPPVDGKANEECLRYLSGLLGVARNRLTIVSGQTSRKKSILISGMGRKDLEKILSGIIPPDRAPELFDIQPQKDHRP